MAEPFVRGRGTYRLPARRPFASLSDDEDADLELPTSDLALALLSRVNLLVVGDDDSVDAVITSMWRSLPTPICVRGRGERLSFASGAIGTLIVRDVNTLTSREQRALCKWIDADAGRTQVVSTALHSMLPMLETGAFDQNVYYRLNVITLDLTHSNQAA